VTACDVCAIPRQCKVQLISRTEALTYIQTGSGQIQGSTTGALPAIKPEATGMETIARWQLENNLNV